MLFYLFLLTYLINLLALAAPTASYHRVQAEDGKTLNPRQVLTANPSLSCCTSCTSAYSYDAYWNVFNDFCTWAGNGLELWTGQSYATGDYYCKAGGNVCIHLMVKYTCGGGSAYSVSYSGCMSYFLFAVSPSGVCGGAPYPGARIKSSDDCWIFQATADKPPSAASNVALVCDDGRSCSVAGSADAATAESFSVATVASD